MRKSTALARGRVTTLIPGLASAGAGASLHSIGLGSNPSRAVLFLFFHASTFFYIRVISPVLAC